MRKWAWCLAIFVGFLVQLNAVAKPAKIWIFKTHLTGALNQRLGVAQRLSSDIEILESIAQPGLTPEQFMRVRLGADFGNPDLWPDLILHTEDWKHELDFLLELSQISPKRTGIIYLENPKARLNEIDLVVVPTHQPLVSAVNVYRPMGVASHLTDAALTQAAEVWRERLAWMPRPLILVALGGDALHNTYRPEFAADLGERLRNVVRANGGSVLVTTTRRTPENGVLSALMKHLRGVTAQIYDWHRDQDLENPYLGGLALATHVVVTGDSMSMLSDAVFAGKPLYIHAPMSSILPEHARLIEDLYVTGRARPFTGRSLQEWTYERIDVAGDVAREVRKRFACEKWLTEIK